jgi:hypothetical protein
MRKLLILEKITEILLVKDGLTVPQIQYQLRKLFGIAVHQKLISTIISLHMETLNVIHQHGQSFVILTPQYRDSIKSEKTKNERDTK